MLEKTMKSALIKKVNDWLGNLESQLVDLLGYGEEEAQKKVEHIRSNVIITGGSIVSLIQNETPNDYDIYFRDKQTTLDVAQIYVDLWNQEHHNQENKLGYKTKVFVLDGANLSQELLDYYNIQKLEESQSRMIAATPPERVKIIFPSDGIVGDPEEARNSEELGEPVENLTQVDEEPYEEAEEQQKLPYGPVFLSTNAITLRDGIQVVVRFYGESHEIHETYDFVHTKGSFDVGKKELDIPREVYEAVINKNLRYTGSKYPVCSLFRMRKFIERGWHINAGQILTIVMQVNELDLNDIDVLQEQLIGIDSIYFMQLIEQFRRRREKDPNFQITSDYVMSIVDKIF